MLVEGPSPSTRKRTRFPPHPSLRLWMEHPSRWKVNPCLSDDILCAYLDGATAPKDAIRVSEHMAECATCVVRLRELGQMMKLMGAALDGEISKDAPTERLRAQFKAFLNEASEPIAPAKTVAPSLLNSVHGSAARLPEWLGGSFRRLAFASVMVVSIAIVVTLAIATWRSGSLKTGSGEKATQAVNSTDSTNSQAQTPDQARGKPASGEQTTANNHREPTASARAGMARPNHVNLDNRPLKAKPKESSLPSGESGGPPYVASTVAPGDSNKSGVLDGENTRPFKGLAHSFASDANPITAPDEQMRKLEEIHREYRLSPGARVEVSNINGPVEIETADTDRAEVHITRFAQGLADVNDRKLKIVDTPNSLTIQAEGNSLRMGGNEVRHRVSLKIPRRVDLTIKHVSDRLKVGEIYGSIHLNGLSWKAEMSLAAGQIEISRVSGTAVIRVTKLDEQGINISNVSGKVELLAPADLNANIDVNGNHGKVILGLQHKMHEGTLNGIRFRAQIGSGGAPISISNIIGAVSLRQL